MSLEAVLEVHFTLNWLTVMGDRQVPQDSWWVPARPPLGSGALSWVPVGGWCWSVPWEPALLLG